MKRMIMLFVLNLIMVMGIMPLANAQTTQGEFEGHPTFITTYCDVETLLSKPVCINNEYLRDEFYVVLKDKPNSISALSMPYQVKTLQSAINTGAVSNYHNELERIQLMPSLNQNIKQMASEAGFDKIVHVRLADSNKFADQVFRFSRDPAVKSISFSGVAHAVNDAPMFNDPLLQDQYSLPLINAPKAFQRFGLGDAQSIIGVFDTGRPILSVEVPKHPDLDQNIFEFNTSNSQTVLDRYGHSTHVGGIATARANNHEGIVGICPKCSRIDMKVLNDGGSGYWDWITDGILMFISKVDDLQKQNPLITATANFSLAGPGPVPSIDAAFAIAYKKDIVVVAAAGNNGFRVGPGGAILYPAAAPGVIVAVAVGPTGHKAGFSNYAPGLLSTACPGVNIISAIPIDSTLRNPPSYYGELSGTSMASPCIAGAIGNVRGNGASRGLKIRRETILGMVIDSVRPFSPLDSYTASGGILDLESLNEIPINPPAGVTEFNAFGTSWGSTLLAFVGVNDSLGKNVSGFLVSYSKNPFDENSLNRQDVTTVTYNLRKGREELNIKLRGLEPQTKYYITLRPFDKALNVGPLPDTGVIQITTQQASVLPGAEWTFTAADGSKDPQGFRVDNGPISGLIEAFSGEENPLLWHLSDIISSPDPFRWNWWFGRQGTLRYETSVQADAMVLSPILDLTDMHYGPEIVADRFQQFLSITDDTQDRFEIHAYILNNINKPVDSVRLYQSTPDQNSTALRLAPIRADLQVLKDRWVADKQRVNDGSLEKLRVVIAFRVLSLTQGADGGVGVIFGNVKILQNPQ